MTKTNWETSFLEEFAAATYNKIDFHKMSDKCKFEGPYRARRMLRHLAESEKFTTRLKQAIPEEEAAKVLKLLNDMSYEKH